METEREVVFFFGAGASADFGLPTMGQFVSKIADLITIVDQRAQEDTALADIRRPRPIRASKIAAYDLLRRALALIEELPTPPLGWFDAQNVEHVFCLWQMQQELGIPGTLEKLDVLARAVAITFQESHSMEWNPPARRVSDDKGYGRLLRALWQLYGNGWESSGLSSFAFITTNYDLAIEDAWDDELERGDMQNLKAILRDQKWHGSNPHLSDDKIQQMRRVEEANGVRLWLEHARYGLLSDPEYLLGYPLLLKLHGSINWGICPSCGTVKEFRSGLFDRRLQEPAVLDVLYGFPCDGHPETRGIGGQSVPDEFRYRPLLVPPTWSKARQCADIREVWRKAALEIRAAKRLVFVGYSMPDTDVHLKYLLAASLSTCVSVPPVLVVNYHAGESAEKEEEDTRKRYQETLGNHRYVNKKFADAMADIRDFLTFSAI